MTSFSPGAFSSRDRVGWEHRSPAAGQPSAGELERRIGAQDIEIVGILVAAADREHPGPDHVGDRMGDPRAIAPIGNAACRTLSHL